MADIGGIIGGIVPIPGLGSIISGIGSLFGGSTPSLAGTYSLNFDTSLLGSGSIATGIGPSPSPTAPGDFTTILGSIGAALGGAAKSASNPLGGVSGTVASTAASALFSWLNIGRLITIIIGLILIIGGIFMLKPVQDIDIKTVKEGSKAAEVAAVAA